MLRFSPVPMLAAAYFKSGYGDGHMLMRVIFDADMIRRAARLFHATMIDDTPQPVSVFFA